MKVRLCSPLTLSASILLLQSGCNAAGDGVIPGYVEGEYVRIASPYAGSLSLLNVRRGDTIAPGAPLFALEQESERAAREEAAARVRQAQSRLEDLRKGKRPEEVNAVRAQLAQAEASLAQSAAELKRAEDLVAAKFQAPSKLDEARASHLRDRSRVAELEAQLSVARLAGRRDEIAAAEAEVAAARELLAQAEWRVGQKSQRAPQAGVVADTLYVQGEWVQAGMPVVSLLPAENIKLRFFVAEKALGSLKVGQEVRVSCDGCAPLSAKISYIAPQAEFTSPLIYSKENRASLVFMIEARALPEAAVRLHPGQPVEIRL